MDILHPRTLKKQAADRLGEQSYSPRRLALIHTAAASVLLLAVSIINYMLSQKVGTTSGLSGLGLRSILQTAQVVLQYASGILIPFWQMGFIFAAISMARTTPAEPRSLLEGFRRFGPVLRLMLLRGLIYGLLCIPCAYISSIIFTFTPFSQKAMDVFIPLMESGMDMVQMQSAVLELPTEDLTALFLPVLVIFCLVYGITLLFFFYRFRLSDYIIMDKPGTGARAALKISGHLSRKKRLALLRLDLSFWWYYVLEFLTLLVCNADGILSYLNVELPIGSAAAYLLTYALGLAAQILLFTFAGSKLHTTWAVAYDTLAAQSAPVQPQNNTPWAQQ